MSHDHDHTDPPSDLELRVKALESLLLEKGLVKQDALNAIIETYEHQVGPKNGAHVVAKAWSDLSFKQALLADATATVADLGYVGRQESISLWLRTLRTFTIWWSAPCAHVIPGHCSGCPRVVQISALQGQSGE